VAIDGETWPASTIAATWTEVNHMNYRIIKKRYVQETHHMRISHPYAINSGRKDA